VDARGGTSLTLDSCTTRGNGGASPEYHGLGTGAFALGNGNHSIINCDLQYTCVYAESGGLAIRSSRLNGAGLHIPGKPSGTILSYSGINLAIDDSVIENSPGAVYAGGQHPNQPGGAVSNGGYIGNSKTTVTSTTFRNNTNAAISNAIGLLVVANSTFVNNSVAPYGSQASNINIFGSQGSITLIGNIFENGNTFISTPTRNTCTLAVCADIARHGHARAAPCAWT
jgi:hypothetical protein